MITKLWAKNFGPHEIFDQTFERGINLFVAGNGKGKSNVVYAIGWAILGAKSLPSVYKQKDIIRDGASQAEVALELDLVGIPHRFEREFDGSSISARVFRDGELVAETASGVEQYVESLGLDWHAFSVLCSRQRDLDAFVYATPADRKRIFDSLMRTGVMDTATKIARKEKTRLTVERDPVLEADRADLEGVVHSLGESISSTDFELGGTIRSADRLRAQIAEAQEEVGDSSARLDTFKAELDSARSTQMQAELAVSQAQAKVDRGANFDLVDLQERVRSAAMEQQELTAGIAEMTSALDEVASKTQQLIGTRDSLDNLANITADSGECGLCGLPGGDITNVEAKIKKLDLEIAELTDLGSEAFVDITEKKELLYAVRELIADTRTKLDAAEVAEETKPVLAAAQESLRVANMKCQSLEAMDSEFVDLSRRLSEIIELERNLAHHVGNINSLQATRLARENELKDAEARLARYDAALEEFTERDRDRGVWAETEKNLSKFRTRYLNESLAWVSARATQIWQQTKSFKDVSADAYLELDDKLWFWVVDGDRKIPVYRFSGGQTAVFSICLRMALSEYLTDRLGLKGLLILDAVFDGVDDENCEGAAEALGTSGPEQALVFSHFDIPSLEGKRIEL